MEFDEYLLTLIRRAAPTPTAMRELIAAVLNEFTFDERREILAGLNASGISDEPLDGEWHVGGSLAHGDLGIAFEETSQNVSTRGKQALLMQLADHFPGDTWLVVDGTTLDFESRLLAGMQRTNRLLIVSIDERRLVPNFQFEPGTDRLPRFSALRTNEILQAGSDPWGALSWWVSPNGWIGGQSPCELLGTENENTVARLAESLLAS